ncbi:MAG: hypothetical protein Q9219_004686 [cf. Caloplaca sp. 3 TL-2023]
MSSPPPPHILLVPGFWEGPTIYTAVLSLLRSLNHPASTAPLPSTGHASPNNPTMKDDVASIRSAIVSLIEDGQEEGKEDGQEEGKEDGEEGKGKEVLLGLHSAGGFLGSMAMEGLSVKERRGQGKRGGVVGIVFLAGAVWEVGFGHWGLPFFDVQGPAMYCHSPKTLLFNDLPSSTADDWASKLSCQPSTGWGGIVDYAGWKDVPSVYVVCERDAILGMEMQMEMAERAGSVVERCDAGHCCMISRPARVVEVLRKAAGEWGMK